MQLLSFSASAIHVMWQYVTPAASLSLSMSSLMNSDAAVVLLYQSTNQTRYFY